MIKAKDIMTTNIIYASSNYSIFKGAKIMKENNVGFLPIIDGDYLYGVITDRDIVTRAIANNSLFTTLKDCATTSPIFMVKEDTELIDIINLMSTNKIRRVLVFDDNGNLKGIISIKDIILSLNIEDNIKGIFADSYTNPFINIDTTITL